MYMRARAHSHTHTHTHTHTHVRACVFMYIYIYIYKRINYNSFANVLPSEMSYRNCNPRSIDDSYLDRPCVLIV